MSEDVRVASRPLLATKLSPPQLRRDHVARPDLVARLAEARRLTLLSAPAGYGKTTTIAAWLAEGGSRAAWLTLDESDDDVSTFLAYVIAAIRRVRPLDPAIDEAVLAPPISEASLTPLINALAEDDDQLTIVLDDYHLLSNPQVHGLVAHLVAHAPPTVRAVIAGRQDPDLPLARLRARDQLAEVRAADLRFSLDEARTFLARAMRLDLSEEAVRRLTERTEGWAAGLQLAGLSLRATDDPERFVEEFGATDRYIFDYLTDEALARQVAEVRSFLEATCVLERLTGPLCDALTGRTDGGEMLAALDETNVFVTPLDDRRTWYRYHRLFADLLTAGLASARAAELHERAATWFAGHDMPEDAIRHRLAAGDADAAADLMERIGDATLSRGAFNTLVGWSEALPESVLLAHPALVVLRAAAQFYLGDIEEARRTVASVAASVARLDARARGRRACLEAWFANRADDPAAVGLATRAIDELPLDDPVFRSLSFTTLGEAQVGTDAVAARHAFEQAAALAHTAGQGTLSFGAVYSLSNCDLVLGRRREAESRCRSALAEFPPARSAPAALGMVRLPLGVALFEAAEFEAARQEIVLGRELCERAHLGVTMLGAAEWQEIIALHLLGGPDEAWRRVDAARRDGARHGIRRLVVAMGLVAAELLLLEGQPRAAAERLERVGTEHTVLGATRDHLRSTQARVLLALDRPVDALAVSKALADEQRAGSRRGRLIATLVLVAAASERVGPPGAASTAIDEALRLAADEDWRRPFLDPVFRVDRSLRARRSTAPAFVDDLLARLGAPSRAARGSDLGHGLVEPLSARELEVLRLVAAGLSNDEIGRQLFVSTGTAKWHVHNLLAKTGARDRVALVATAHSRGLA